MLESLGAPGGNTLFVSDGGDKINDLLFPHVGYHYSGSGHFASRLSVTLGSADLYNDWRCGSPTS